ncbi:MAG: folylpolyglutamate synthase/dihydrofolate synthase family protein [Candidatus Anstonellales archaeon]
MVFDSLLQKGSRPGLDRIKRAMEILGNPQENYPVILVAGTNGKGSVVSYISSFLKESGYKVGSYFSPHLVKWSERVKVNGKEISDGEIAKYEARILEIANKTDLTEFEASTALAYTYFSDKKVDFAVMEVGMGGRLDATNVAKEKLSVITRIDFDHMEFLGESLERIAGEKAGIMKNSNAIVCNVWDVFDKRAKEIGKKAYALGRDFFFEEKKCNMNGNEFLYKGKKQFVLKTTLIGKHQMENASIAARAGEELGISEDGIVKGIEKAKIKGRLEIISKNPFVVFDSAHNPNGAQSLKNAIQLFNKKKFILVFGAMRDKDWKKMLDILKPDVLIATEAKIERSERAENIANYYGGKVIKEPKKAIGYARSIAGEEDLIIASGSIYMLGEMYG